MKLKIKVITPQFMQLVNDYLKKRCAHFDGYSKLVHAQKELKYLQLFWNGKMVLQYESIAGMTNEQFQAGIREQYGVLANPQYLELIVENLAPAWDFRPHIIWNGEKKPVENIAEIFHVEDADDAHPLSDVTQLAGFKLN